MLITHDASVAAAASRQIRWRMAGRGVKITDLLRLVARLAVGRMRGTDDARGDHGVASVIALVAVGQAPVRHHDALGLARAC